MLKLHRFIAALPLVSALLVAPPPTVFSGQPAWDGPLQVAASAGPALLDKLDGFFEGLMKGAMAPNAATVALDGFKVEAEKARDSKTLSPDFFKRYVRIVRAVRLVTATSPDDPMAAENEAEIGRFVTDIIGGAWSADLGVSEKIGKLSEAVASEIAALRRLLDAREAAAPALPREPVRVQEADAPKQIKNVDPVYPDIARAGLVEGVVILEVVIDEKGNVKDVKVIRSKPLLDQAAIDAVKQWKYEPFVVDGKPVPFAMSVTVTFSLK